MIKAEDLRNTWRIIFLVIIGQLIGLLIGYVFKIHPELFISTWVGAAIGTLPGFLLGLIWHFSNQERRKAIPYFTVCFFAIGAIISPVTAFQILTGKFITGELVKTKDIFIYSLNNIQKVEIRNNIQWRIVNPLKYSSTLGEKNLGNQHAKAILLNSVLSKIESDSIDSIILCKALSFDKYCEINRKLLDLSEELSLARSSVGMEIELMKSEVKLLKQ